MSPCWLVFCYTAGPILGVVAFLGMSFIACRWAERSGGDSPAKEGE